MSEKMMAREQQQSSAPRGVKWVEGLRGVAALLVVTSHLGRAFAPSLANPAESDKKLGSIWHLPILRFWAQGSPWVALFFLLTGYVNILGPVKKARDGQHQQALMSLASSAFRRPFRLILPTAIAGFFAWLMCQLGFYAIAASCDAWWMNFTSPLPDETFRKAVKGLFWNSFNVWRTGEFVYEKNQWSLPFLLQGSMKVYLALLAVIRCTPKWRMAAFGGLWMLSWAWNDAMVGLNVYAGAFLSELNLSISSAQSFPSSRGIPMKIMTSLMILLALYFCSYPETNSEWRPWSANLGWFGKHIFPKGVDMYRFWPAVGVQLITISIMFSPMIQHVLSHPALLWLGSISFPMYLIHGPIIRSVLAWLLFGLRAPITKIQYNQDGTPKSEKEVLPMPTAWMYMLAMPLFFIVLFVVSHGWNLYIEPWCAYWTRRTEETMFGISTAPTDKKTEITGGGSAKQNGILPH